MTRPNNAFQPTPLRGPKIVGILESGFLLTLIPIYWCGAAECWPLGGKAAKACDCVIFLKLYQYRSTFK